MKIYQYANCSTCKQALAWLKAKGVEVESIDLVANPLTDAELRRVQKLAGVPVKKLFNVAGQAYRDGDFKTRLPTMTDTAALTALASDGKLVKRPILLGDNFALVGFDETSWLAATRRR
jgi:arsenate reductase